MRAAQLRVIRAPRGSTNARLPTRAINVEVDDGLIKASPAAPGAEVARTDIIARSEVLQTTRQLSRAPRADSVGRKRAQYPAATTVLLAECRAKARKLARIAGRGGVQTRRKPSVLPALAARGRRKAATSARTVPMDTCALNSWTGKPSRSRVPAARPHPTIDVVARPANLDVMQSNPNRRSVGRARRASHRRDPARARSAAT